MPLASTISLPQRYRVLGHIASGGMASVWEAEDLLLGRVVAVKVLGAQYAADPEARARFQREARTAAQVSDQTHVVTIYDIGEHGDDAFIVMEHFAGGTVADRLRAARDSGSRVPFETSMRWLREAANGLDVAHAAGIVHRDVKPANLLLDARDRLAVADFGIARLADDTQMTQTGQVLGTAAYISPEQALGHPATAASDRYALAVVAYELLTGTRPFAGGPPTAQARQHAEEHPSPASEAAPGLPAALDGVLARGLAKDPSRRPRTATELVAAIESALGEGPAVEPTRRFAAPAPTEPVGRPRTAARAATPPPDDAAAAASAIPGPRPRATRIRASPPPATGPPAPVPSTPAPPPGRVPREPSQRRAAGGSVPRDPSQVRAAGGSVPRDPSQVRAAGGRVPREPSQRRAAAILSAALVAAAAVVLALVLAGGSDQQPQSAKRRQSTAPASGSAKTPTSAVAPQPPPPPPRAAQPQPASGDASPSSLNDQGFALMKQGRYGEAVAPLRAAVSGYQTAGEGGLPYAYALFNLAQALNRSGNPAEAVPLLRERLKFDNQRGTVQAELDSALAKLGGAPAPAGGKHLGKPKKADKHNRDEG
jgi:hypothetical protein